MTEQTPTPATAVADTSQPQPDDETVERMAEEIWGDMDDRPWTWRKDIRAALAVARPLVAKAQREADLAALRQDSELRQLRGHLDDPAGWAAAFVRLLPLISEPSR